MICERIKCREETLGDLLYCSDHCYELDNDPIPITVLARNKAGGFGRDLQWSVPDPVHVSTTRPPQR